jgi:DNA polymerase-3 subunit gamma/tau
MLSTAAFNALLKTLEEPPPHALFVLATTEPHKIPDTISSRCQRHDFRRVSTADLVSKLERICAAEGVQADADALEAVARGATGSIRDGESLLDQLMSLGETVTMELVREVLGTPTDEAVGGIVDAIADRDAASGVRAIHVAIDRGADVRQLQSQLLGHLRGLLLIQTGIDHELLHASQEQVEDMARQAARIAPASLLNIVRLFNDARLSADMTHPSLPLELAVVESVLGLDDGEPGAPGRTTPRSTDAPRPLRPARADGGPEAPAKKQDTATIDLAAAREKRASKSERRPEPKPEPKPDADPDPEPKHGPKHGPKPGPEHAPDGKSRGGAEPATPKSGAPAAAPRDGRSPLARVEDAWGAIVKAVAARDKNTAALLKDCRVAAADRR